MNQQPRTLTVRKLNWLLALVLLSTQSFAQAPANQWDFGKLGEPVASPRAQVTLKGFVQKVHELNDQIVADDTDRTRQRDAQRRNSAPPPSPQAGGAAPPRTDPGKAAARWVCKLRCTDAGFLNEKKGEWMSFDVSASSKSEAQNRGWELARRHCAVVRQEWGGPQCDKQ